MEQYKGKTVPPVKLDMAEMQEMHCNNALKCGEDCADCLFSLPNVDLFSEWYLTEGSKVRIRQRIRDLYTAVDVAEDLEEVRRMGKEILELEAELRQQGSQPARYRTVIHFEDRGQEWKEWHLDERGRILEARPNDNVMWHDFQVVNRRLQAGEMVRIRAWHKGKPTASLTLALPVARVERKEVPHE